MTREEFGQAVAALLTDDQRLEIARLHAGMGGAWLDGCAAHAESAACCVDALTGIARDDLEPVRAGESGVQPPERFVPSNTVLEA